MSATPTSAELLTRAVGGDRLALARAITRLERRSADTATASGQLAVRRRVDPGSPHVVGLTGPPGAGKSTFASALVRLWRARGQRVAVIAVDPSSPFSGGAILGDRVRMEEHTGDDGVFVRSLSSRGHVGGLSSATAEVVDLFDACGYDRVLVETVGVGQSEIGIMEVADTVVVVLTPESGDAVQAMKAGLMEIAHLFVVNKADRPGAAQLLRALERMSELDESPWRVAALEARALDGTGVAAVIAETERHLAWCTGPGRPDWHRRRGSARVRLFLDLVAERARRTAALTLATGLEDALRAGRVTPWEAVEDHDRRGA